MSKENTILSIACSSIPTLHEHPSDCLLSNYSLFIFYNIFILVPMGASVCPRSLGGLRWWSWVCYLRSVVGWARTPLISVEWTFLRYQSKTLNWIVSFPDHQCIRMSDFTRLHIPCRSLCRAVGRGPPVRPWPDRFLGPTSCFFFEVAIGPAVCSYSVRSSTVR